MWRILSVKVDFFPCQEQYSAFLIWFQLLLVEVGEKYGLAKAIDPCGEILLYCGESVATGEGVRVKCSLEMLIIGGGWFSRQ